MKVAVIGATGNVGSALLRALEHEERVREVVGIARRRPTTELSKVTWATADVVTDDLEPVLRQQSGQGRTGQRMVVYQKDSLSHGPLSPHRQAEICRQD